MGQIERIKYNYKPKEAGKVWKAIAYNHIAIVKISPDIKKAWNDLIKWSMGHDGNLDKNKSIGLVGRTGSGKTMTMYILNDFIEIDTVKYKRGKDLVNLRFKFDSAIVIAGNYSLNGYDSLYKYSNYANLCIDDLGSENTNRKYFGDAANVIQELIEIRHTNGLMTHFTSNLTIEKIKEIYGDRIYSRLLGNTNIITMNDCDYRIK